MHFLTSISILSILTLASPYHDIIASTATTETPIIYSPTPCDESVVAVVAPDATSTPCDESAVAPEATSTPCDESTEAPDAISTPCDESTVAPDATSTPCDETPASTNDPIYSSSYSDPMSIASALFAVMLIF